MIIRFIDNLSHSDFKNFKWKNAKNVLITYTNNLLKERLNNESI